GGRGRLYAAGRDESPGHSALTPPPGARIRPVSTPSASRGCAMRTGMRGLLGMVVLLGGAAAAAGQSPDGKAVAEVLVRGNRLATTESVLAQLTTRKDRAYSQAEVQMDVGKLMQTRQFSRVTPYTQPAAGDAVVVTFDVQ